MYIKVGNRNNAAVGNMLDYIEEYGRLTFLEKPFCEVDSLIFSQFAYLKFDGIVPLVTELGKSVTIEQMAEHPNFQNLFADERWKLNNRKLFEAMVTSNRFRTTRCNYHVNIIEEEKETQFSAITYILQDATVYIAFRGTDETLVGWKEDFNMILEGTVPGQRMSADYINQVSGRIREPFYVGGHSKGGNLAVYGASHCYQHVRDKILGVYDHDGPGFRDDITVEQGYQELVPVLHKTLPHSSVVGVLLNRNHHCKIIASKNIGARQHDPFSWLIVDGEFLEFSQLTESSKKAGKLLQEITNALTDEEINLVINTLYQIVLKTEETNLIDLKNHWRSALKNANQALKDVDPETKKKIRHIVIQFLEYTLSQ